MKPFLIILISLFTTLTSFGQKIKIVEVKHLKDTVSVHANYVLFLRPDSVRFEDDAITDDNIYTADSDFGFAISETIDSVSKTQKYKGIKTDVTSKRYIQILGCKSCPMTLDRDTIDYGILFIAKGKKIKLISDNIHGGNYLSEINEYFSLGGNKTKQ